MELFAEVSFRVRYGAPRMRSLRKIGVNLYRRRVLGQSTRYCAVEHISLQMILSCRSDVLCGICTVQIQPRKRTTDHADDAAPTRQHGLL